MIHYNSFRFYSQYEKKEKQHLLSIAFPLVSFNKKNN